MWWWCPPFEWVFHLQVNLKGNGFKDLPRGICITWFQIKSVYKKKSSVTLFQLKNNTETKWKQKIHDVLLADNGRLETSWKHDLLFPWIRWKSLTKKLTEEEVYFADRKQIQSIMMWGPGSRILRQLFTLHQQSGSRRDKYYNFVSILLLMQSRSHAKNGTLRSSHLRNGNQNKPGLPTAK